MTLQNFYCYDGAFWRTVYLNLDNISAIVVGTPRDNFYAQVYTSDTNVYEFKEDVFNELIRALKREGVKCFDANGNREF